MTFHFSPYNLKFLSTMTFLLLSLNVALVVKYFQKVNLSHPLIYLIFALLFPPNKSHYLSNLLENA